MLSDLDLAPPQNDIVFKMIFADPKHERILIHSLNCAIQSPSLISSVRILNNEITGEHVSQKG